VLWIGTGHLSQLGPALTEIALPEVECSLGQTEYPDGDREGRPCLPDHLLRASTEPDQQPEEDPLHKSREPPEVWTKGLSQEVAREGVPREGPPRKELLKEVVRDEALRDHALRDGLLEEALRDEAVRDEAVREGPLKEVVRDEALRDGLLEEALRDQALREGQTFGLLQQLAMKGLDHHLTLTQVKETFSESLGSEPS